MRLVPLLLVPVLLVIAAAPGCSSGGSSPDGGGRSRTSRYRLVDVRVATAAAVRAHFVAEVSVPTDLGDAEPGVTYRDEGAYDFADGRLWRRMSLDGRSCGEQRVVGGRLLVLPGCWAHGDETGPHPWVEAPATGHEWLFGETARIPFADVLDETPDSVELVGREDRDDDEVDHLRFEVDAAGRVDGWSVLPVDVWVDERDRLVALEATGRGVRVRVEVDYQRPVQVELPSPEAVVPADAGLIQDVLGRLERIGGSVQ